MDLYSFLSQMLPETWKNYPSPRKLTPRTVKNPARLEQKQELERIGWHPVHIAKLAGTSKAAVTKFFNGEIETSDRIENAIDHLLEQRGAA